MLFTDAYALSSTTLHPLGTSACELLPMMCRPSTRNTVISAYRPRFVSDRLMSPMIGAVTLIPTLLFGLLPSPN